MSDNNHLTLQEFFDIDDNFISRVKDLMDKKRIYLVGSYLHNIDHNRSGIDFITDDIAVFEKLSRYLTFEPSQKGVIRGRTNVITSANCITPVQVFIYTKDENPEMLRRNAFNEELLKQQSIKKHFDQLHPLFRERFRRFKYDLFMHRLNHKIPDDTYRTLTRMIYEIIDIFLDNTRRNFTVFAQVINQISYMFEDKEFGFKEFKNNLIERIVEFYDQENNTSYYQTVCSEYIEPFKYDAGKEQCHHHIPFSTQTSSKESTS